MALSSRAASACCSLAQLRDESLHLVLERIAVVRLWFRADVADGGEHVAVFAYFFQGGAFAEAGDVGVGFSPSPQPSPSRGEGVSAPSFWPSPCEERGVLGPLWPSFFFEREPLRQVW